MKWKIIENLWIKILRLIKLIKLEKISIIITTFNRSDNVIEIIKLLNKQLNFSCDLEIIICDSN